MLAGGASKVVVVVEVGPDGAMEGRLGQEVVMGVAVVAAAWSSSAQRKLVEWWLVGEKFLGSTTTRPAMHTLRSDRAPFAFPFFAGLDIRLHFP